MRLPPDPSAAASTSGDGGVAPSLERSVYGASPGIRRRAFTITLLLHVAAILLITVRWSGSGTTAVKPSAPLVVTLQPLASPSEAEETEREKPVPERRQEARPQPQRVEPIERTAVPLAEATPLPPPLDAPKADPAPRQTETAAPRAAVAPPAAQAQSSAPDSWEGRVLARLEKFRRYPPRARGARQQGVVHIRFRMNRAGRVLSASLVRSSGFPELDRAALETLRRAEPLPVIPADRPDELELAVPVEFYLR